MWKACMDASGPNKSAIDRIHRVGDIIRDELPRYQLTPAARVAPPDLVDRKGEAGEL